MSSTSSVMLAHVGAVGPGRRRVEQRRVGAVVAGVLEGVVEVVVAGRDRIRTADPSRQPELFEVRDMRVVPDEGGHGAATPAA